MSLSLARLSLACLAASSALTEDAEGPEVELLRSWRLGTPGDLEAALGMLGAGPESEDLPLLRLGAALSLSVPELLAVSIALAVETDPMVGRAIAWLQAPLGGARPTLGLLATAFSPGDPAAAVEQLATGLAVGTGLLVLTDEASPLPERAVAMPGHLLLAAHGKIARFIGATTALGPPVPLPDSVLEVAARHADGLRRGLGRALVVRSGHAGEGRAVCAAVAQALGKTPLFLDGEPVPGLVPWLHLAELVPVFLRRLGPGERLVLPPLVGWEGPILAACGPDGSIDSPHGAALSWTLPIPAADERRTLWEQALGDKELAGAQARSHRHGAGRIAELGRLASHHAAISGRERPIHDDVLAAAWQGDGGGLEALAQPLRDRVPDEALVLTEGLRRELNLLLARCRQREDLAEGLGIASTTRYRTGVRALFVGPSGTGKTLAVSWLATKLSLPLYRVDAAAVTSKYIGETEKNLAELLARAESAEVVLFFDEADSLFGKRTEVRQSTDRFANAQTNYLLQRIESYDGIVILASNSRTRFDPAFTRRLDLVVEFPPPGPEERRELWIAHLGEHHQLSARDLNRLAAACDLAGGHVRNAVLAAAVLAREDAAPVAWDHLVEGLAMEMRKLGRPLPSGLERRMER